MKASHTVLTLSTLTLTLGWSAAARAANAVGLSFELAPPPGDAETADSTPATPLPIPPAASQPPLATVSRHPAGRYGGSEGLALAAADSAQADLPAPPPLPADIPTPTAATAAPSREPPESPRSTTATANTEEAVALLFTIDTFDRRESRPTEAVSDDAADQSARRPAAQGIGLQAEILQATVSALFEGGSDSLVARAVGSAEGTRTPEGHKTAAYFGHVDPGNQAWNLGTFSYQHGAKTPEEADARQLARLRSQTRELQHQARSRGLELSLEELLNGIDLANQAPLAALDRGGYIDWLVQARQLNMPPQEAILYARTRAFLDPDTQRWNAPGLGNNLHSISRDQARRARAIQRTLALTGALAQQTAVPSPPTTPDPPPVTARFNLQFAESPQSSPPISRSAEKTPMPTTAAPATAAGGRLEEFKELPAAASLSAAPSTAADQRTAVDDRNHGAPGNSDAASPAAPQSPAEQAPPAKTKETTEIGVTPTLVDAFAPPAVLPPTQASAETALTSQRPTRDRLSLRAAPSPLQSKLNPQN